ncbi:MAG: ORF6N domain-containing protein [Gammaproteobacteria bacterium]|jgi:prophage antirepressor-like protein
MDKKTKSLIQPITYDQVKSRIIEIRDQKVILDSDVAELYGVETKKINQAVKRNSAKFPVGYIIELTDIEWQNLRSQFVTSSHGGRTYKPAAFTERGLYMLATILKSTRAINTTIAIINTFAQLKELTQDVYRFARAKTTEDKVKVFENSTEIAAALLNNKLLVSSHEINFKIKLPFLEISRKVTRVKD